MTRAAHITRAVETKSAKMAPVLAEQEAVVFRLLEQAARLGNECPKNARLAQACGMTAANSVGQVLARLVDKGLIEVFGRQSRVVKIVASGLRTAGQSNGAEAEQIILDMITAAARRGEPCPSNMMIGAALGRSPQSAITIINRMEKAGIIRVRRSSQSRIVTIVESGITTGGEIKVERSYAGRKVTSPKARFAQALAEAVHTNDLKVPCARAGIMSLAEGERLFAEICADLGEQAR